MADKTGKVEGKDMCTDISNINGVAIDSIKGLQGKDKKSCATCTSIRLAYGREACIQACRGTDCIEIYTDGTVGALTLGDKFFTDDLCTECASDGFYSDQPCGGSQRFCFTVERCIIVRVDRC